MPDNDIDQQFRREQLRDVARSMPILIGMSMLLLTLLVVTFAPLLPWQILLAGPGLVIALSAMRLVMSEAWLDRLEQPEDVSVGLRQLTVLSLGTGVGWGILILTVLYGLGEDFETVGHLVMLACVTFALSVGATVTYASYPPVFYSFIVPTNLAGAALLLFAESAPLQLVGVVFLVNLACNIVAARNRYSIYRDVTALRHRNENLLDAYREQKDIAESSSRAKSRFLAAASHDLRQPIHAIGLLADTLESQARSPDMKVLSQSISESVNDLNALLGVILDISKIDAGLIRPDLKAFPIRKLLGNLHKSFAAQAHAKGIELRVRDSDVRVWSDPVLLERILSNLVSNAIKYTRTGGVLIGARSSGPRDVRIDVWDTGIGIPADSINEVFLEYYQIGNVTRAEEEGLGLGLSIVKGLCNALGYTVRVKSRHTRGSLFSVTVPRTSAEDAVEDRPLASFASANGARVLLIDDDARVLGATHQLLNSWGCEVRIAESRESAYRIMRQGFSPEIVFCDYRLADMENGSDVLNHIRRDFGQGIQGVLITADTDPKRLVEATASGYLLRHKPLSAAEMRATLHLLTPERNSDVQRDRNARPLYERH